MRASRVSYGVPLNLGLIRWPQTVYQIVQLPSAFLERSGSNTQSRTGRAIEDGLWPARESSVRDLGEFEAAVLPMRKAAFNLAYWILQNRDEAEDVVQDAYLSAFKSFGELRGQSPRPWLLAIVRNTAYNAIALRRRKGRVVVLSEDLGDASLNEPASDAPTPEAAMISEADRITLLRALAALPANFRDVLVLREMEELSYSEIAEIVGAPVGTVMSRLSRGRAKLKEAIQRAWAEG